MEKKNSMHSITFSKELTVVHTDYRHKYKGARVTKEEHQGLVKAFTNHICFLMQLQVSLEQANGKLFWDTGKNLCMKSDDGSMVVLARRDPVVNASTAENAGDLNYRFKYSLQESPADKP